MESVLKDLPALFCSLVPKGSFPEGPTDQLLEELEFGFPKIPQFTLHGTPISQNCKLHQCMITAYAVAPTPPAPNFPSAKNLIPPVILLLHKCTEENRSQYAISEIFHSHADSTCWTFTIT